MSSPPLRVVQVSTADRAGGAEGSAWNLSQAYRTRGHQCWLAVGYKRSQDNDVLVIPNDQQRGVWARLCLSVGDVVLPFCGRIRGLPRLRSWIQGPLGQPCREVRKQLGREDFSFPGTWKLLDILPQRPDIIHCHNLHGGYFDLRALPWLSRQVPLILNLRDAWLLSGHCAHSFDCQRWKTGCGHCPYLSAYPAVRRDATAHNWQRRRDIYAQSRLYITAVSQWLMNKVGASMLQGVQSRVVYNGIDISILRPGAQLAARQRLGLPQQARIMLFAAHNQYKDYATMTAAFGRLEPSEGVKLIAICMGREGAEQSLGRGRMMFGGMERDPERMADYYRAADVFIHAAHDEAFGKTITEALACGTPVVATAVGGIPEQIRDGETGFLTPPHDPSAMAVAVQRLLSDPHLRQRMGQAGVEDVRRRFTLERQADTFLNWYREVIADWQTWKGEHGDR